MPFSLHPIKVSHKEELPLEIYVKFSKLDNPTLIKLLSGIDKISRAIIREYSLTESLTELGDTRFKISPELEVVSINTGNSILWKYKEGWIPTFRPNRHGDLEISINYKIGLIALIASSLLIAIPRVLDAQKTYLENESLREEIKLKRIDRQIKEKDLESESKEHKKDTEESLSYRLESDIIQFVPMEENYSALTEREISKYLLFVQNNARIELMQINGVIIKDFQDNLESQ